MRQKLEAVRRSYLRGIQQNEGRFTRRRVHILRRIARSLVLTVPKDFAEELGVKEGQRMMLTLHRTQGVIEIEFFSN